MPNSVVLHDTKAVSLDGDIRQVPFPNPPRKLTCKAQYSMGQGTYGSKCN